MSLKTLTASLTKSGPGGLILTPVLMDFLFKRDRGIQKGLISKKEVVVQDCRMSIASLKKRILEFNHGEEERIKGAFHPSSMGRCRREMWFTHFGAARRSESKSDSLRKHVTFEFGTYFHLFIQNLCEAAGILEDREVLVESYDPPIEGHCDGILKIDKIRYVLEIKTINQYEFAKLTGPKFEHRQQAMAYMYVLKIKYGIVLYFDKGTGQFKEYVIVYDPVFVKEHVTATIRKHRALLAKKELPPRISEDPSRPPCSYCAFSELCYNKSMLDKFVSSVKKKGSK